MGLKLVRIKKPKEAKPKKTTKIHAYLREIDKQIGLVEAGKKSKWIVDGAEHGVELVLRPMVLDALPLHKKSAYQIDMKAKKAGLQELKEFREVVESGRLTSKLYGIYREVMKINEPIKPK